MALVAFQNLSFSYPDSTNKALSNCSLEIHEGEFIVLFGSTGSGKTTFLKMMKPELTPYGIQEGKILYRGNPFAFYNPKLIAGEIGYVMQNPDHQIVTDQVWHELAFGLENLGIDSDTIRRRVGEMASFFGISSWYHKSTSSLSGGEKQLLNLASIMAMQPKLLLLDEPTSQLDPIASAEFIQTLQKLNREFGLTIVLAEHRLEEVFPIADKVIVMDQGTLLAYDSPRKVGDTLEDEKLSLFLPSASRIYKRLKPIGTCPLTVREGKAYLEKNFPPFNFEKENTEIAFPEPAITIKDLWFRYSQKSEDVLRNLSLSICKGEIFSIVGANASGKSTLLKTIAGLEKPYRGEIRLGNKNLKTFHPKDLYFENIAYLPQNPQDVFVSDTVNNDLWEVAKAHYSYDEYKTVLEELDSLLGLSLLYKKHPFDVSGGEQQKVALAKILLLKPKILLLDEPTKGLDAYLKRQLITILQDLKKKGITIIIVTHDIEFAALSSNRCGLLFDGQMLSVSSVKEFFSGNSFYTTAANRMARNLYPQAITEEDIVNTVTKALRGLEGSNK